MSTTTMGLGKKSGGNDGNWFRRAASKVKDGLEAESSVPEHGGNWIVETGEVSAPDARLTSSLAESRELQQLLRENGGIGAAAASWKDLPEDRVQELVADLERSPEELVEDALKAKGLHD